MKPHRMLTTPATDEAPQVNVCLECGSTTEGSLLPDLPCPVSADRDAGAVATWRGIVRMAALVVMDEVGETDKALATAIAIKASQNLHAHLAAALLPLIREREAAASVRALREAADEGAGADHLNTRAKWASWLRDRAAANPYAGSEGGE